MSNAKERIFDTKVQLLRHQVLKEIVELESQNKLMQNLLDIPDKIVPGKSATMRCCVYKERAIVAERVKVALGGDRDNPNVIQSINIACDECPVMGYMVGNSCRGCIAHRCEEVCPKDAIIFDKEQKAFIDKDKCVECGRCAKVCPYNAISDYKRPCETACKVDAISMSEDKSVKIDNDKCIACGACVYQCPFGALCDKSFVTDVLDILRRSDNNNNYKVYAVVAPSISSQFSYVKLGQVISGIKELGFYHVIEAALGADLVANSESKELVDKGFLMSSCCPAFVSFTKKSFPKASQHLSHNLSPMAEIAKHIKQTDPDAKVIFMGPCTAKKMEFQLESVRPYVDSVITFEELHALLDGKGVDIRTLEECQLNNASYFGRIFARSGGLSDAMAQGINEHGSDFEFKAIICDGIEECKLSLKKVSFGIADGNFVEGMACVGGCIGGAGCLTHGPKDKSQVDRYGKEAHEKNIGDSISQLDF